MNALQFIWAGLAHYRRIHVAVALGVAVATAVLTGALLVGDSVRGSLRALTLERLGSIDSALVAGHMFRAKLAYELASDENFAEFFTAAEPVILINGTLLAGSGETLRRATRVNVVGCGETFWALGEGGPRDPLAEHEVTITEPLAAELGASVGSEIQLRVPTSRPIPADSPLGKKDDTSNLARYRVAAILPPRGLPRYGLMPTQHAPRNIFVPLDALQELIERPGQANAILVASPDANRAVDEARRDLLQSALRPRLEDYGLQVRGLTSPAPLVQIAADQLVLADEVVRAAERAFPKSGLQPVVTYLANTLTMGTGETERKIPYSTITGVDSTAALGPLLDDAGQPIVLADDEIVLNDWAAKDLGAKVGDEIIVTFYEPESTHGELRERQPPPKFKLRAIVDLETSAGEPTRAADPRLTPELPGVTDQDSIADWDLPFELVEKIRPQDEEYWDKYRTTPKAFVSLATAKDLWKSRWGTISLLRLGSVPPAVPVQRNRALAEPVAPIDSAADEIATSLMEKLQPADVGMTFLPVKAQGLAAASGTTPFDVLFLGFSLFLIAAALMLIALLFQLGIEQRAAEIGTLAAVGINRQRIVGLLSMEGLAVAAVGALVGIAAGIGYAWLMIAGLRTWWVAAIATPFLQLHLTSRSLILGWSIGVLVSWLTLRQSVRMLVRAPANQLLRGSTADQLPGRQGSFKRLALWPLLRLVLVGLTIAVVYCGFKLNGEAQAGVFFGSGAVMLALLLGEVRHRLRGAQRGPSFQRAFSLPALSLLNTARHPGRSTLTIGLVAAATYLIVALSAFRLDTGAGGTGNFALTATSDQPIIFDLNTTEGRMQLGFDDNKSAVLDDWRIYSLRVAAGEDASCLNLYRPTQPRVLGVPNAFIDRDGFAFAATAKKLADNAGAGNPWTLLRSNLGDDADGEPIVPVILDASTAIYSLQLTGVGARLEIRNAADRPVTLEVVALLKNSVLQGNLLVSEANFLRLFPDMDGYRFFLIEHSATREGETRAEPRAVAEIGSAGAPPARIDASSSQDIAQLLESELAKEGDMGFDATDASEQLAGFLAVQNTYLSTFQTLGALGLLLGTVGLAVVQLRSVLERRGELALMRATGFRHRRLLRMVVGENAVLLLGGVAVGCAAAAIALIPQWAPQQARVPWGTLAALLASIVVVGLVAGWLATRSALRAPPVPALRGD